MDQTAKAEPFRLTTSLGRQVQLEFGKCHEDSLVREEVERSEVPICRFPVPCSLSQVSRQLYCGAANNIQHFSIMLPGKRG